MARFLHTHASPLSGLASLTELDLGGNAISDVSPLSGFASLRTLYLRGNAISNVWPTPPPSCGATTCSRCSATWARPRWRACCRSWRRTKTSTSTVLPFTGAQPWREPPHGEFVFNLRPSYRAETAGLVDNLLDAGRQRIAVFYQDDDCGRSGSAGVREAKA